MKIKTPRKLTTAEFYHQYKKGVGPNLKQCILQKQKTKMMPTDYYLTTVV